MSSKPPKGEPWIWITREMLASPAWSSLSINARRFVDFLMLENMRHGGKKNGELLAPYRQLEEHGIGAPYIGPAIAEADRAGLVDRTRGTGRRPSVYALTWLPRSDGTEASNRWRDVAPHKGEVQSTVVPHEGEAHYLTNERHKAGSTSQTKGANGVAPYKGEAQSAL